MRYLVLLLLAGCAVQSVDDLIAMEAACVAQNGDCAEIREDIDRAMRRREHRKNAETDCPSGYIAYCDSNMYGCGKRLTARPKVLNEDYYCIRPQTLYEALH